jgi:cytochrome c553
MMVRMHMHENFDLLRAIEKLLVRGKLDEARALAGAIAKAPDEPGLGSWAKQTAAVRDQAARLAEATTVDAACERAAKLATACAGCHVEAGVVPEFRPPGPKPPDAPTIDARMARHLWATDRLWEGIVGAADDSWLEGLDVLAAAPLEHPQISGDRRALAKQLQQLADGARRLRAIDALDDRARAYGQILATCAGCHAMRPSL